MAGRISSARKCACFQIAQPCTLWPIRFAGVGLEQVNSAFKAPQDIQILHKERIFGTKIASEGRFVMGHHALLIRESGHMRALVLRP
ncbi:MAG: hypothetical protein EA339_14815 [Rhodobacteraceae bacterium]|nr:MAG: hypothetical protein EA339_14815 [Paracoccaceae bacterium]